MGYTHYWDKPTTISKAQWANFTRDARKIIDASPVKLAPTKSGDDVDVTAITASVVRTNGAEPEDYETFLIERVDSHNMGFGSDDGLCFGFCKTGLRPYDVVVVALMTALKANVPATQLRSDGTRNERSEGIDLFERATGKTPPTWDCDAEEDDEGDAA